MKETLPSDHMANSNCRIICIVVLLLLAGCQQSSSASEYISKQEAIDMAIEDASLSRPEVSGAQEEVSNVNAEQMSLKEAVKELDKNNKPATGYDPNMIVWLVTMDGLWLGEMPAPGIVATPSPVPYHHFAIIIDAKTGSEIESSLRP